MDSNISKILEVMEDIKQDITDNQYKTIMDSLTKIYKKPSMYQNHQNNKFVLLFEWLDKQIVITDNKKDWIKRGDLYKFIITEYFNNMYYQNINFVKEFLKIYFTHPTKIQDHTMRFVYVGFRDIPSVSRSIYNFS